MSGQQPPKLSPFRELFERLGILVQDETRVDWKTSMIRFLARIDAQQPDSYEPLEEGEEVSWRALADRITGRHHDLSDWIFETPDLDASLLAQDDPDQLEALLETGFVVASKARNKTYFIEQLMALSQSAQLYFADLLKPHH